MEEDVNLKAFDGYDEDLNENSFFKCIQTKHKTLYDEAAKRRWIICVPRKGTLSRTNHTLKDVENHFLQPTEAEGSQSYRTLNEKSVKVNEGFIFTEKGFEDVKYVRILFEETFFNDRNESYQVLCLDQPLEGGIGVSADPVVQALDNLQGCIDFLWPSTGTKQGQKQIDEIVRLFNSTYQQLAGESLRHLMDAANAIYTRAMQAALKNSQLRKLSQSNKSYLDNVKLAIETYVMHGLYNQLTKGISSIIGNEDAALNKITRNLADIQIRDLGIKPEICINLPRGRRVLSFLNRFTSPLEKFHCLKKSITLITERKIKNKESGVVDAITADDLLPALVFLVIKSDIPNWLANITFLHNFHFSKCGYNEFQFYLSSLEAAVEHVRSGSISSEFKGGAPFKRLQDLGVAGSYSLWQPIDYDGNKPTALDMLFEYTAQGNEREVEKLIGNEEKENVRLDKMCHPLCSCDMCEKLLSKRRNDPSAVTVFSRDDMGRTVLHVAAEYGHANLTYALIHKGGVVNTMDYHGSTPLHMACLRGHSKVVLILLHYKADANAIDNDGNTPMHLCAANGHDQCCKSLVYSDMHYRILKINVANENGDTPLHLAARWGYVDLVDLLIERGASIEAHNKNKQTPLDCAYSQQVSEMILDATAAQLERETGFLAFLPDEEVKNSSRSCHVPIKCSTRSSLAGSPASSLERHSPKEVDVFLRTVADGDIEMVRFRLSLDEEDEEDGSDMHCKSEKDLCHPLCQCDKCIKWQKLTSRSPEHSVHVNCSNKDGVTPLHVAAVRGFTAIANLLLRHGADPNAKNSSKQHTPLHLACQYNHPEVTELLLNYSAKINIKDYKGNSPLHFCCLNGHLAPALVLLERNVNVDVPNDRGNTPLHEAARWNFSELVRVLLEHGACANVRNKSQLTPMQYGKHDDVIKVLEQSDKIAKERGLKRRKTWAGLSLSSNLKEVSLPNPVESLGTSPNPTQPIHQKSSTASIRVSYSNATKTVELEERPRLRSRTESSLCDTTIEQPQTKLSKIFEHLEHGEVEKLQEIVKAVRAFDRRKSLKRAVTIDKSVPHFDLNVDRDALDEFNQDGLCNDDLYNQPIIPPNNTPVEPEPYNSGPLLDRVRNVLLDNPPYRAGHGPLLERVHNILVATEQEITPTNNYEANDDSVENLSEKKNSRGNDVEEVISKGPVLESVHPELVSIVQREIEVLEKAKESDGNLVKTFKAESGCLGRDEVSDDDDYFDAEETLRSVGSEGNHPENENFASRGDEDVQRDKDCDSMERDEVSDVDNFDADETLWSVDSEGNHPENENFASRGDIYEDVQRDKECDSTKASTSLRSLEDENIVNLEEAIEIDIGARQDVSDSLSSSCEVFRSKDCQHNRGDNFNQNNNVDWGLADDGRELSPHEQPNDYYDSRFVNGSKNKPGKAECELIAESALYDIEKADIPGDFVAKKPGELREQMKTHGTSTDGHKSIETCESLVYDIETADIPGDFIAKKRCELREQMKTHGTSVDGLQSIETCESSTVPIESVKTRERSTDRIESDKTRETSAGHHQSVETVETSTELQDSSSNGESTFEKNANREPEFVETGEFGSIQSLESNKTFETSNVFNGPTVIGGDGPQRFMVTLETTKTHDAPESAEKCETSIGSLEADNSCETSTVKNDSMVEERDGQLEYVKNCEISTACGESALKANRPESVQSHEIPNKRESPTETAKPLEISESGDLPETDKNRKTPRKSDNPPQLIKNPESLDESCELYETTENQEALRTSKNTPESFQDSEILTERGDLLECSEKEEASRESEALPEPVETRESSMEMSTSDSCENDKPTERVEIHQASTLLKSADNRETSTSYTAA